MKINVIVKIRTKSETIEEVYKEAIKVDGWSDTDRIIKECQLEVMNESPYSFSGASGNVLLEENGNAWRFECVEV